MKPDAEKLNQEIRDPEQAEHQKRGDRDPHQPRDQRGEENGPASPETKRPSAMKKSERGEPAFQDHQRTGKGGQKSNGRLVPPREDGNEAKHGAKRHQASEVAPRENQRFHLRVPRNRSRGGIVDVVGGGHGCLAYRHFCVWMPRFFRRL